MSPRAPEVPRSRDPDFPCTTRPRCVYTRALMDLDEIRKIIGRMDQNRLVEFEYELGAN